MKLELEMERTVQSTSYLQSRSRSKWFSARALPSSCVNTLFSLSRKVARMAIWFSLARRASRLRLAAMLFFLRRSQQRSSLLSSPTAVLFRFRDDEAEDPEAVATVRRSLWCWAAEAAAAATAASLCSSMSRACKSSSGKKRPPSEGMTGMFTKHYWIRGQFVVVNLSGWQINQLTEPISGKLEIPTAWANASIMQNYQSFCKTISPFV